MASGKYHRHYHKMKGPEHTGTANQVVYQDTTGVVQELALGAANTFFKFNGASSAPTAGFVTPTVVSRTVATNTTYQPSTTQDVLVCVSVQIRCNAAADEGTVQAVTDSASPPTTVVGTLELLQNAGVGYMTAQLVFVVKANNYYRLNTTQNAGLPTFAVIGDAWEARL